MVYTDLEANTAKRISTGRIVPIVEVTKRSCDKRSSTQIQGNAPSTRNSPTTPNTQDQDMHSSVEFLSSLMDETQSDVPGVLTEKDDCSYEHSARNSLETCMEANVTSQQDKHRQLHQSPIINPRHIYDDSLLLQDDKFSRGLFNHLLAESSQAISTATAQVDVPLSILTSSMAENNGVLALSPRQELWNSDMLFQLLFPAAEEMGSIIKMDIPQFWLHPNWHPGTSQPELMNDTPAPRNKLRMRSTRQEFKILLLVGVFKVEEKENKAKFIREWWMNIEDVKKQVGERLDLKGSWPGLGNCALTITGFYDGASKDVGQMNTYLVKDASGKFLKITSSNI